MDRRFSFKLPTDLIVKLFQLSFYSRHYNVRKLYWTLTGRRVIKRIAARESTQFPLRSHTSRSDLSRCGDRYFSNYYIRRQKHNSNTRRNAVGFAWMRIYFCTSPRRIRDSVVRIRCTLSCDATPVVAYAARRCKWPSSRSKRSRHRRSAPSSDFAGSRRV